MSFVATVTRGHERGESNAEKPTASAFSDPPLSPGSHRARGHRDVVLLCTSDHTHCYRSSGQRWPEIPRRLRAYRGGGTSPRALAHRADGGHRSADEGARGRRG